MRQPGRAHQEQALDTLGIAQGEVERDAGAHRDPAGHERANVQVVEQGHYVVGKRVKAQQVGIAKRLGLAVTAAVHGNQVYALSVRIQLHRLAAVAAQAVLEDEGEPRLIAPVPGAFLGIPKVDSLVVKACGSTCHSAYGPREYGSGVTEKAVSACYPAFVTNFTRRIALPEHAAILFTHGRIPA